MASRLKPGDVVGFVGELGSGKTTLIQLTAQFLGVKKNITSPTYLFIKTYPINNRSLLVHCDAYRLNSQKDVDSIDLPFYLNDNNIVLIEWVDKIKKFLPQDITIFKIELKKDNRTISLF